MWEAFMWTVLGLGAGMMAYIASDALLVMATRAKGFREKEYLVKLSVWTALSGIVPIAMAVAFVLKGAYVW